LLRQVLDVFAGPVMTRLKLMSPQDIHSSDFKTPKGMRGLVLLSCGPAFNTMEHFKVLLRLVGEK